MEVITAVLSSSEPYEFTPAVDIVDLGECLEVSAELPGLRREEIRVRTESDTLVLEGAKVGRLLPEGTSYRREERSWGSFRRALTLPHDADLARAQAALEAGVLVVRIPKKH